MKTWGARRHLVQAAVLVAFFITPVQLDLDTWRIHFFGMTLVPGLFHIFCLAVLLPFFGIFALSALFNKVFCGWMCPQNIFYEAFEGVRKHLCKYYPAFRHAPQGQKALDLALTVLCGLVIAGYSLTYFKGAHPIFSVGLFSAVFAFFVYDIHWLKHRFCKTACPYAFIQKSFATDTSMHVAWEDRPGNKCGTCVACEKACYVDLNPRKDAFHLDCTQCGACLDACDGVFARSGKPSLLTFAFEEKKSSGFLQMLSWPKRFVALSFVCFFAVFVGSIVMRPEVTFRVDRPTGGGAHQLPYKVEGVATNAFRIGIRNLADEDIEYSVRVVEEGFHLVGTSKLHVKPLDSTSADVEVRFPGEAPSNFMPITFELSRNGKPVQVQTVMFRLL